MSTTPLTHKASNLVQYIKELTQLRQKPVYSYKNYEDIIWIDLIPEEIECIDCFRNNFDDWLYVKKPITPTQPDIPETISEWIIVNPTLGTLIINESITISSTSSDDNEPQTEEIFLKDMPHIDEQIEAFENDVWIPYITESERVKNIQKLYDRLYKIHQELQHNSETLELVVSVGLLQWKQADKDLVERHLLTSEVELQFNKSHAEMTIVPSSQGNAFELEEDMLLVEDRLFSDDHKEVRSLLKSYNEENTIRDNFDTVLKSIVNAIDSRGVYSDTLAVPNHSSQGPILSLSPAIVLRKKSQKSFQYACDTAIEQLNEMDDAAVPENLANMLGNIDDKVEKQIDELKFQEAQEYYFPLPTNDEQNRIIATLNNKSSVLVQGPPGTGKTHTIANLTSHLLATGQRVLITSQTAKALSVLKSKLPEELQDLSVSLLGGDSASMKDLEKVVSTISVNKERFDLTKMTSAVTEKEQTLKKLKQDLNKTKTNLMEIREAETYIHNFDASYQGTAQQIATQLNKDAERFDWYTTPINIETPESFLLEERNLIARYIELKNTHLDTPIGYDQFEYPSMEQTVQLENLVNVIKKEQILQSRYQLLTKNEIDDLQNTLIGISDDKLSKLTSSLSQYDELLTPLLFNTYPNLKKVINDIFINRGHLWARIEVEFRDHLETINKFKSNFDPNLITVDGVSTASLKKMTEDLVLHFTNGGKMGNFLFQPKIVKQYKATLQKIQYNNLPIKTEDDIKRVHAYALTKDAFESIEKLVIPHLLDTKPIVNELALTEYETTLSQLSKALKIQQWRSAILEEFAFLSADLFNEQQSKSMQHNIEIYNVKSELKQVSNQISTRITAIENVLTEKTHSLYSEFVTALSERNIDAIQTAYTQYDYFQQVMNRDNEINMISIKLEKESSLLLKQLNETYADSIWNKRFSVWEKAQNWRKMKSWLGEFAQRDEATLTANYDQIDKDIRDTITEIGTTKAWISMLSTMTHSQSKHLKAWARSVKNYGKGYGTNAPRFIAEAQYHMQHCKDAIPAWIMPLSRVFENFEIRPNLFDIVIVDEASQSWHDALLLKYLARKMIIVGDDKQISPSVIGIQAEDIYRLNHKYLKPFEFEFADTLNATNSFFDVSYIMFKDTITLREHYRCMPEIIGFSNRISYTNSPLIPLRQYPANRLEPIVSTYLPHGVREGSSQNAYNEVEADEIVKSIRNCIKNPRYDGKTIGVISLLGNNQAKLIQNKLIDEVGAEVMEERQIICGDAYAFQGDERDVIFLSMVVAKGKTRLTAQTADSARQRFNVAASRAKDQLWVMHSISVNDISNRDCLRYNLLTYIADPLKEETEANREKCESKFEIDVFDAIVSKGYRVIPQFEVAGYRLDLVVQGEKSRLVVECDGDHWHTSIEDRERDFLRERLLQRAGWTFWRVLGSTYYHNPEKALESLWTKLEELNIKPYLEWAGSSSIEKQSDIVETEDCCKNDTEEPIILETANRSHSEAIQPVTIDTQNIETQKKTLVISTAKSQLNAEDPITLVINELNALGLETIDYRNKSKTLYVIGDTDLGKDLKTYRSQNLIFRPLDKGNKTTGFRSAWYAKIMS
ncbi:AAA domain-containing protein [Sporosarcina ureilytica]|uniref:Uncharacterized protein n=1 Tax=Sporosarcina ureilytica TaxID=298596 RepID=A0A1D8JFA6_9BACL|nr:AAA domain-containing protein [Sporosarcina ureilytica]AOV07394.1 hypothetical protein BI350_07470 [Sporosarcina ureilytica]